MALHATLAALNEYAQGDLADFGCGTAPFYGAYKDLADSVYWVDWPYSPHATQHLDVVAYLNKPLVIETDSFDTVFTSSVLEHIWKHDVFLDEITRVLRTDGNLVLVVPFMYWLHEEPHDFFLWPRHALTRACEGRGLEIVELEPYGGGLDLLLDMSLRALASISLGLPKLDGRPIASVLMRPSVRRQGRSSREKLPLGYVLVAKKPGSR